MFDVYCDNKADWYCAPNWQKVRHYLNTLGWTRWIKINKWLYKLWLCVCVCVLYIIRFVAYSFLHCLPLSLCMVNTSHTHKCCPFIIIIIDNNSCHIMLIKIIGISLKWKQIELLDVIRSFCFVLFDDFQFFFCINECYLMVWQQRRDWMLNGKDSKSKQITLYWLILSVLKVCARLKQSISPDVLFILWMLW